MHLFVIIIYQQNGKQLALENANVEILSRFRTDEVRSAYNFGYTGNRSNLWTSFGSGWVQKFQIRQVIPFLGCRQEWTLQCI